MKPSFALRAWVRAYGLQRPM